jgi:hypothetical protein
MTAGCNIVWLLAYTYVRIVTIPFLKPSGAFRFIEHVRARESLTGKIQDLLTPLWRWFGAGCRLNRQTAVSIEMAGFEFLELEQRRLPLIPLIIGTARPRRS